MIFDKAMTPYERVKRSVKRRKLTSVQMMLNPAELAAVDRLAEHVGMARTAVARWIVTEAIKAAMQNEHASASKS